MNRMINYARQEVRQARAYLHGRGIQRRYTAHYLRARRAFAQDGHPATPSDSLRRVGVHVIRPDTAGRADRARDIIPLPDQYAAVVARLAADVARQFERSSSCRFFPALPEGPIAEWTRDVPSVRDGEVITIQMRDPFTLDAVQSLCDPLLQLLEQHVYGSYVRGDRLYVYRSPISRQTPRASWLWHYDNHPREVLKVMVYLTDVSDERAPFEYLRHTASARPLLGSPLSPDCGNGRIDDTEVSRVLASGCESVKVTGPAGTLILFDNNVVHRARLARAAHRDVVVLQVRPASDATTRGIDPRWTGTFQHTGFDRDPDLSAPGLKAELGD